MKSGALWGAGTGLVAVANFSSLVAGRELRLYDPVPIAAVKALSVAHLREFALEIDEIDQQIVALLRENARRSFQDIGSRVALSAPAVKRRVDRLEQRGVIRGYSAVLDHAALGWSTHAVVSLYCDGRMTGDEILAAAGRHPEVAAAHTVAGESSAILHLFARDTVHLEEALQRLREAKGVLRTQTQVVLSTLFERPVE